MEHLKLAFAAALCLQLAYWGWLLVERKVLARRFADPTVRRWFYGAFAVIGALLMVCVARGVIHWGRSDGIGDPVSRRLVVGFFLLSVILYDLFRVTSREWGLDGKIPYYWKAKWVAYCLLFPIFALSVANPPVVSDPVSLQLASMVDGLLNIPVLGAVAGGLALLQTVISDIVCGVGLILLFDRQSRPR